MSSVGSADVLEALGIRIDLTPEEAARSFARATLRFFLRAAISSGIRRSHPRENSAPNAASGQFSTSSARCIRRVRRRCSCSRCRTPELCGPMARAQRRGGPWRCAARSMANVTNSNARPRVRSEFSRSAAHRLHTDAGKFPFAAGAARFARRRQTVEHRDLPPHSGRRRARDHATRCCSMPARFVRRRNKNHSAEGSDLAAATIDGGHPGQNWRNWRSAVGRAETPSISALGLTPRLNGRNLRQIASEIAHALFV